LADVLRECNGLVRAGKACAICLGPLCPGKA
jgi:hypothetical protein